MKLQYMVIVFVCFLFPRLAWCELPQLTVVTATSENIIDRENNKSQFDGMSHSSGGAVLETTINDQPVVMVVSFGQSFAGQAFSTGATTALITQANYNYGTGSTFLNNEDIFRKVLLDTDGAPDYEHLKGRDGDGTKYYNEESLIAAEEYYWRALSIDPYNKEAIEGIIQARLARVQKGNLVWDIRRREQLCLRLTKIKDESKDKSEAILKEEIDILKQISDIQRSSIALILELYSDTTTPNGPGTLLRGEGTITSPDIVDETMRVIFSAGQRFGKAELDLGRKRMLLNFFDQDDATKEQSRAFAVNGLANASAYITELIRFLNPYFNDNLEETNNDKYDYGSNDVLPLTRLQDKLNELMCFANQGYNPFGFLNEFVPFEKDNTANNNLSTFNKMYDIASRSVVVAKNKEEDAIKWEEKFSDFAQDHAQYKERLVETELSYTQRLKTLIGTVKINNEEEPDVYTFLYPDRDLDNDGKSERDKAREKLKAEKGFDFGPKGEIKAQYDTIDIAEKSAELAFIELENIFNAIKIYEETSLAVLKAYGKYRDEALKILSKSGKEMGALIRQKGKLEADAAEREFNRQKNMGMISGIMQFAVGAGTEDPVAAVNGLTTLFGAATAENTQGQLALDLADIDAKMNEIKYLESSDILIAETNKEIEIELARTKQQVKERMLDQATKSKGLLMAQRNLQREFSALFNKISEVGVLIADQERMKNLLSKNKDNLTIGWVEGDAREVLTDNVLKADQAFFRAQVWTFVALRALEYYASKPPENGQPHSTIRNMYEKLYRATRSADLSIEEGGLLKDMEDAANSDFSFTLNEYGCGLQGRLSLKYDVFVPTSVDKYEKDGRPIAGGVNKEDDYRYLDPHTGELYKGKRAYQSVFRNALRQGITGKKPRRNLTLVFATNLYPRDNKDGVRGNNPFYIEGARAAKIIGFENTQCAGMGDIPNKQGIQVNLAGKLDMGSTAPMIRVAQRGNSYIKHTPWDDDDYDDEGKFIDPLKKITVYSSYRQVLPTWLIGDIDSSSGEKENYISSNETLDNAVLELFSALLNGEGSGGNVKALAFTDRAVANDRWEIIFKESETDQNGAFFSKLDEMLKSPVPEDPSMDFLTDIQLFIGWAYRSPETKSIEIKQVD